MDEFISILPDIMIYLVSGFIFMKIFSFVCTAKNPNDYQHIIIKSVIIGYILKSLASFIPALTDIHTLNILGYLGLCCILAYITALIYQSKWFYFVLRKIGIYNTLNDEFWVDIEGDKSVWTEIYCSETKEYYYGLVCLSENFKDNPRIVLKRYSVFDEKNNCIKDYNKDPCKRIIIDTSKCSVIKLTYDKNSEIVNRELKENIEHYMVNDESENE